jgi:phosphate starvation-inducible PhoH-like protein
VPITITKEHHLDDYFEDEAPRYKKTVKRERGRAKEKEPEKGYHHQDSRPALNLVDVSPKTDNQKKAFDAYRKNYNLLLYGTAGTGKTFCALYLALKQVLSGKEFKKVIIVRSAAPTKDSGFLPGSLAEKSKIYEMAYTGVVAELFNRENAYEGLKKMGILEFTTTSYLRGLTFKDAIVILDEFQNGTMHEIHTVITRIGENCRVIISGDTKQIDLVKKYEISGGAEAIKIIENMPSFRSVEFDVNDIVRSGICREWILSREDLNL